MNNKGRGETSGPFHLPRPPFHLGGNIPQEV